MIRARSSLLLLLLATLPVGEVIGRDVTLRWNPNPSADEVTGYRVYRGIDMVVETSATSAPASVETGDILSLVAVNSAGVSDPALYTVPPPPPPPLDRTGWIASASSAETVREDNKAANAIDNNLESIWHTTWGLTLAPHYLRIELPHPALISGLRYLPRQDGGTNGIVTGYEIETSTDGLEWTESAAGTWSADATWKRVDLPLAEARFVRLWGSDARMAAAEVMLEGTYIPDEPSNLYLYQFQTSTDQINWTTLQEHDITIPDTTSPKRFWRSALAPK